MNMNSKAWLACILTISTTSAFAVDVSVKAGLGIDTNPHRLASQFSPEEQNYIFSNVRIKSDSKSALVFDASMSQWLYQDLATADSSSYRLFVGYKDKLLDNKLSYRAGVRYQHSDRTYVSRFSGQVYQTNGQSAEDRYDYSRLTPSLDLRYRLNKQHYLLFDWEYRVMDYEDYTALGLSNLDYEQWQMSAGWLYRSSKATRHEFSGFMRNRVYDDRAAKDLDGKSIVGLNSEYAYQGIEYKLRHQLAEDLRLSVTASYTSKEDNAQGYYDTNYLSLKADLRHTLSDALSYTVSAAYRDLAYTREGALTNADDVNDELPDNQGIHLKLAIDGRLASWNEVQLSYYANANYYNFDSDTQVYRFDGTKLETGIQVRF